MNLLSEGEQGNRKHPARIFLLWRYISGINCHKPCLYLLKMISSCFLFFFYSPRRHVVLSSLCYLYIMLMLSVYLTISYNLIQIPHSTPTNFQHLNSHESLSCEKGKIIDENEMITGEWNTKNRKIDILLYIIYIKLSCFIMIFLFYFSFLFSCTYIHDLMYIHSYYNRTTVHHSSHTHSFIHSLFQSATHFSHVPIPFMMLMMSFSFFLIYITYMYTTIHSFWIVWCGMVALWMNIIAEVSSSCFRIFHYNDVILYLSNSRMKKSFTQDKLNSSMVWHTITAKPDDSWFILFNWLLLRL